jgi:hypothetical protein
LSKYTTEVRFICETASGLGESKGYTDIDTIITNAIPKIFNFTFPIFDENYRTVLEKKILKHFYTREIGEETVGLWKLRLDTKLNEIMPYYNKLYRSELLEFNPLHDVDVDRTHDLTNDAKNSKNKSTKQNTSSTGSSTTSATNYDLFSDTPQGALTGVDNEQYLTTADKVINSENDATNSSGSLDSSGYESGSINTTEKYLESVSGKQGTQSYSSMIMEYRETFLNIDMLVINELQDLFINLW